MECGAFVLRRGAFAFFARLAAQLFGSVAPVQDLDEIAPGRAIEVGGDFDHLHHCCPERSVRGLEMIVVGGRADATALHDLGACTAFEEGFVYDLALCWCELVYVRAKDVIEVLEVVEPATRYRRGRVVLALAVPCEDPACGDKLRRIGTVTRQARSTRALQARRAILAK